MELWIERKYINLISGKLDRFKQKTESLYTFRCPFCGDSKKNKFKTRGFFFKMKDSFIFKCHNCDHSCSLYSFLEFVDKTYSEAYKLEQFKTKYEKPELHQEKTFNPIAIKEEKLLRVGAIPLGELADDHAAIQYVKSRRLPKDRWQDLYYLDNTKKLEEIAPLYFNRLKEEPRILIPLHDTNGYLTGVSCRAIEKSPFRYINVNLSDGEKIYGYKYLNFTRTPRHVTKDIYVTEGAFDSMFVNNAIAVSGINLKKVRLQNLILIFDNQPRNKEVVKVMAKHVAEKHTMVIWPNDFKYKDINEAIIDGVNSETINDILYKNTFRGLTLELKFRGWKKCY